MGRCKKIRYPSQEAAERNLVKIAEKKLGTAPKLALWVYPCRDCRGWHLTSQEPSRRRKWEQGTPIEPFLDCDEAASLAEHIDVVYEVAPLDRRTHMDLWVDAMRQLNLIEDPLARKLIALHTSCDCAGRRSDEDLDWPCDTLLLVAEHYGIEHPGRPVQDDQGRR